MLCRGEEHFFAKCSLFCSPASNQPNNSASTTLWPFCPSPSSKFISHFVNPIKTVVITFLAQRTVFNSFRARSPDEGLSPLFRLFLGLQCVPVDSGLVEGHKTMQKRLGIALEQLQALLLTGLTIALVVPSKQTWQQLRSQLFHAQNFMEDMTHAVFLNDFCLSISSHFN